jgi:hypothetical protein
MAMMERSDAGIDYSNEALLAPMHAVTSGDVGFPSLHTAAQRPPLSGCLTGLSGPGKHGLAAVRDEGCGPLAPTGAPAGLGVVEALSVSARPTKEPAHVLTVPV